MIVALLLCAAITFGLRYFPLQLAGSYRESDHLKELSSLLPAGLMLILVAYTFIGAESSEQGLRLAIALAGSLLTELMTRNVLLAFILGIIFYSLTPIFL